MTKKKIAILVLAFVMLASGVVGGTLAYLTDSGSATNVFTLGQIDVDITEPDWSPDPNTGDGDGLGILPGDTFDKTPTITATEGDSYMRVKMEIIDTSTNLPITSVPRRDLILNMIRFDGATPATILESESYALSALTAYPTVSPEFLYDATAADSATGVRYYNYIEGDGIFSANDGDSAVLFTNIVIPTNYSNADFLLIGNFEIQLTVEAIQSDNFDTVAAARTQMDLEF